MDKESLANVSTLKARAAVGASEASAVLWWTVLLLQYKVTVKR